MKNPPAAGENNVNPSPDNVRRKSGDWNLSALKRHNEGCIHIYVYVKAFPKWHSFKKLGIYVHVFHLGFTAWR
jgi:hypothetical protein